MISPSQKQLLIKRFQEGMTGVNKGNLPIREAVAKETGLSTESVNVSPINANIDVLVDHWHCQKSAKVMVDHCQDLMVDHRQKLAEVMVDHCKIS